MFSYLLFIGEFIFNIYKGGWFFKKAIIVPRETVFEIFEGGKEAVKKANITLK
ncbi:hypothetical protein HpBTM60_09170 [Helicobacter pylori]